MTLSWHWTVCIYNLILNHLQVTSNNEVSFCCKTIVGAQYPMLRCYSCSLVMTRFMQFYGAIGNKPVDSGSGVRIAKITASNDMTAMVLVVT